MDVPNPNRIALSQTQKFYVAIALVETVRYRYCDRCAGVLGVLDTLQQDDWGLGDDELEPVRSYCEVFDRASDRRLLSVAVSLLLDVRPRDANVA